MLRKIALFLFIVLLTLPIPVYADSLSDLASSAQDTAETDTAAGDSGSSSAISETNEMIKGLSSVADMTEQSETVVRIVTPIQKIVTVLVQVGCYILTLGLMLRCVLDLIYILVPFSRELLMPGGGGNAAGGSGMGMGMDSGYGMNGGYGGGYGGYGGGYGGRRNNNNRGRASAGGRQWVSEAAVQASQQPSGALSMYAKDMTMVLILTPILIVLAISGTFVDLGFLIGSAVTSFIGGTGSSII